MPHFKRLSRNVATTFACCNQLMARRRNELGETFDRAAAAHPGINGIAARAEHVAVRLQVESCVEIEGGAILVEARADACSVGKHEIDRGIRKQRPLDRYRRNAPRALALEPVYLGQETMRLNGHPQDDFVLDDEAGHAF